MALLKYNKKASNSPPPLRTYPAREINERIATEKSAAEKKGPQAAVDLHSKKALERREKRERERERESLWVEKKGGIA